MNKQQMKKLDKLVALRIHLDALDDEEHIHWIFEPDEYRLLRKCVTDCIESLVVRKEDTDVRQN